MKAMLDWHAQTSPPKTILYSSILDSPLQILRWGTDMFWKGNTPFWSPLSLLCWNLLKNLMKKIWRIWNTEFKLLDSSMLLWLAGKLTEIGRGQRAKSSHLQLLSCCRTLQRKDWGRKVHFPHKLALLPWDTVGNRTPNLGLCSQRPNLLTSPASWIYIIGEDNYVCERYWLVERFELHIKARHYSLLNFAYLLAVS